MGKEKVEREGKNCVAMERVILILYNSYCLLMGRCCEALRLLLETPCSGIAVTSETFRV